MRSRSWVPVVALPVAGVGVVLGMTLAVHASPPAAPSGQMTTVDVAAPATPRSPAPPAADQDPEHSTTGRAPARVATSGTVMTDQDGLTVYTLSTDRPGVSTCTGACSRTWVPVRPMGGKPQAGAGLPQSALGSMQRPDGSQQVTVYGLPLYHYTGDTAAGAVTGQGRNAFGGTWTAAAPPAPPTKTPATTGTK